MKGSTTLEMHQAVGTDYHTMAACQLRFRDLLDNPHGRVHGTSQLVGKITRDASSCQDRLSHDARLSAKIERFIG